MKCRSLSAATLFCIALAASRSVAREFGPEWTKVRAPNGAIVEYRKEITVPVLNYGLGGGSGYRVRLESDEISMVEIDNNKGFSLENQKYGRWAVWKNLNGTVASHEIRLHGSGHRGVVYSDLNGDGILDAMTGGPSMKAYILLDHCFVEVRGVSLGVTKTTSPDGKTHYIFENGRWRVESRAYDFNGDGWPDAKEVFVPSEPVVWIWFEEKMIPVKGSRVDEAMREATSTDDTKYEFQEGKWRVKK